MWSRIKQLRKQRGLKQIDVAYQAGVSLATLQNIEAGKANPSVDTLAAILDVLGMKISIERAN